MRYLIVGQCATGKDTVAQMMERRGLKRLVSYTDRPRRPGEGDTHVFVRTEDLPTRDVIAKTQIGEYTYLSTKEQFDEADIYVIDPDGVEDLDKTLPDDACELVYVMASPATRMARWVARAKTPDAEAKFMSRTMAEMARFARFESMTKPGSATRKPFRCVSAMWVIDNDDDDVSGLEEAVAEILGEKGTRAPDGALC